MDGDGLGYLTQEHQVTSGGKDQVKQLPRDLWQVDIGCFLLRF